MKIFYKIALIILIVAMFSSLAISISMYFWPRIPAAPVAAQGRIYPLNNHGRYTYMNRQEYLLRELAFWVFIVCMAAGVVIDRSLDPFDRKVRPRLLDPKLPPWQNQP